MREGIVLIGHGSPDPDWRAPLEACAARVAAQAEGVEVRLAFMERTEPTVPQAVAELVEAGVEKVRVIALLLSGGGRHMKRDVPTLVDEVAQAHPDLTIDLDPRAIGTREQVIEAMASAVLAD